MNLAPHLAAGQRAEDQALELLRAAGLKLLARNYRCPQGELDLVMNDGET
ncbi:MAG: YraN family protein, partial [Gammaproteobacteria bacterium]|nr:YraN family protein [Gammaproteobacteria bacterium]